ncbi:MAG: hypothetical protein JWL95_528 [Gemmatimonadetes bacterium]|nr:hypothetical protein [Gemmatimonadota bacterium]
MTLLAPGFLYAALAAAAAVIALHFLVSKQPPAGVLPTARFVPDRPATVPATATTRATRPSDVLLMLIRVLLVLAAGAALARPVLTPARRAEARVILVDASRSVGNAAALRDGAQSVYRSGDAVVVFDSAARAITGRVADSLRALRSTERRGRLSAALVAALRAASTLRESADSLELVIVSPLAAEESVAATGSIRALWPGRARVLRVGGATPAIRMARPPLEIVAPAADPLAIAVALARRDARASALIVRDPVLARSPGAAWPARAIVHWPSAGRPEGAVPRARSDTIGGVIAGRALVVAPFERRWSYPRDSVRGATVIARWADGEPAGVEWARGAGCTRSIAIPVPAVGDLVLRSDFIAMVNAVGGDCESAEPREPMASSMVASLAGTGGRASRLSFQSRSDVRSWLAPWLLAAAIALAIAELIVRARSTRRPA